MDLEDHKLTPHLNHPRLTFKRGDMVAEAAWVEEQIATADALLPLAAIANPALYVQDPLRVFELDFEANLPLVRSCVKHKKRLIFPSTSEVYGMCPDPFFDEETSPLVVGPISKQRWIYSASKQLLDRVIYAHGVRDGLDYTLFRPFNWIGPLQDALDLEKGGEGRVIVQFLGNILRGLPLQLVDGGQQRRSFTDITDGVGALLRIIENKDSAAHQKIFNIGNPANDVTIKAFAENLLSLTRAHPLCPPEAHQSTLQIISADRHFGAAYQDVGARVPSIAAIETALGWTPHISLKASLEAIIDHHLKRLFGANRI
jgi:nucleoside-diphosphate-sugar epimerase